MSYAGIYGKTILEKGVMLDKSSEVETHLHLFEASKNSIVVRSVELSGGK